MPETNGLVTLIEKLSQNIIALFGLLIIAILIIVFSLVFIRRSGPVTKLGIGPKGLEIEFETGIYLNGIPQLPKSNPIRQSFEKGQKCINNEKYKDALVFLNEALGNNPSNEQKTAIYNFIGVCHLLLGNYLEAEDNLIKSSKLALKREGKSTAFGNLGIAYDKRGVLEKALEYYQKALDIDRELNNKEGIARTYKNIGIVFKKKGMRGKALEYYQKALDIDRELNNKEGIARAYMNIGVVDRLEKDYDNALDHFHKSLRTYNELGKKEGVAIAYGNIGNVYLQKKEYEKALSFYQEGLEIDKELDRTEGMAIKYGNIGNVYMAIGNLDLALEYYKKGWI